MKHYTLSPEQKARKRENERVRKARDPETFLAKAREAEARWRAKPENLAHGAAYMASRRATYAPEEATRLREENRLRMLREENQRRSKNRYTLGKYGLTLEEYERIYTFLLESQQGQCAACGEEPSGKEPLNLDHHHETGVIRALLCGNCNRALGILRDDPKRIAALLAYAERHYPDS
jgi:hypothetical protein